MFMKGDMTLTMESTSTRRSPGTCRLPGCMGRRTGLTGTADRGMEAEVSGQGPGTESLEAGSGPAERGMELCGRGPGSRGPGGREMEPSEPGGRETGPSGPGDRETGPSEPGGREMGPSDPGVRETGPCEPGVRETGPCGPGDRETGPNGRETGPCGPGGRETGSRRPGGRETRPNGRGTGPCGPGGRKTGPCEPGGRETGPCGPGGRETGPCGRETGPSEPGGRETGPSEPGGRETGPSEPGGRETGPCGPGDRETGPSGWETGPSGPGDRETGPSGRETGPRGPSGRETGPSGRETGPSEPGVRETGPSGPDDRRSQAPNPGVGRLCGAHISLALLIIVGSFLKFTSSASCGPNEIDVDGTHCCRKCLPGSGVASVCTATNDTLCAPCMPGNTFSAITSHSEPCRACAQCPTHSHLVAPCNVTNDIVCECDWNFFWSETDRKCTFCDLCPVGQGAWQSCSPRHNTKCRRCPSETFSDRRSLAACRPCRVCSSTQMQLQECNFRENTVCIDIPKVPTTVASIILTEPSSNQKDGGGRGDVIPVYCALLGAVVAGLVIYVIVTQIRRGRTRSVKATPGPGPGGLQAVRPGGGSCGGQNVLQLPTQGSDSGVGVDGESRPGAQNLSVSDLAMDRKMALESLLHAGPEGGGWRALAKQLGYNNSQIASLEARANLDAVTPSRYLVAEWCKTNGTVGALQVALSKIGREDIAAVLHPERPFLPPNIGLPAPASVRYSRETLQERSSRRHSYRDLSRAGYRDSRELHARPNADARSVGDNRDTLLRNSREIPAEERPPSYDL